MAKNDLNRLKVVLVEQHKTAKWLAEQMEKTLQLLASGVPTKHSHH